jgi:pyrroline-5-carboxylate reductase
MSNQNISIGFIGAGNMAQAIIRGLLNAGHPATRIFIADPATEQQRAVSSINADISCSTDNADLASRVDVLVLAVKPQLMAEIVAPLADISRPREQLIVSVAAGITLESLAHWFGSDAALVRVMPNQPALVGAGMSGLCAGSETNADARNKAAYVMQATGNIVWLEEEALMDAVTAVSGSGPAYFYLVMEIMQQVAEEEFGFDAHTARELVTQTALGAGKTATVSEEQLAALRAQVTSPGGTTAAALQSLEAAGIRDMFRAALKAARDRSVELGRS